MSADTTHSDFGAQEDKIFPVSIISHLFAMKLLDRMPGF